MCLCVFFLLLITYFYLLSDHAKMCKHVFFLLMCMCISLFESTYIFRSNIVQSTHSQTLQSDTIRHTLSNYRSKKRFFQKSAQTKCFFPKILPISWCLIRLVVEPVLLTFNKSLDEACSYSHLKFFNRFASFSMYTLPIVVFSNSFIILFSDGLLQSSVSQFLFFSLTITHSVSNFKHKLY